jgi:hypothetical protein
VENDWVDHTIAIGNETGEGARGSVGHAKAVGVPIGQPRVDPSSRGHQLDLGDVAARRDHRAGAPKRDHAMLVAGRVAKLCLGLLQKPTDSSVRAAWSRRRSRASSATSDSPSYHAAAAAESASFST